MRSHLCNLVPDFQMQAGTEHKWLEWVFALFGFGFLSFATMLFAPVSQCPNLPGPTSFHPSLFHIPLTCTKCPNKHNLSFASQQPWEES